MVVQTVFRGLGVVRWAGRAPLSPGEGSESTSRGPLDNFTRTLSNFCKRDRENIRRTSHPRTGWGGSGPLPQRTTCGTSFCYWRKDWDRGQVVYDSDGTTQEEGRRSVRDLCRTRVSVFLSPSVGPKKRIIGTLRSVHRGREVRRYGSRRFTSTVLDSTPLDSTPHGPWGPTNPSTTLSVRTAGRPLEVQRSAQSGGSATKPPSRFLVYHKTRKVILDKRHNDGIFF